VGLLGAYRGYALSADVDVGERQLLVNPAASVAASARFKNIAGYIGTLEQHSEAISSHFPVISPVFTSKGP
jgi:hypothetical protein